MASMICYLVFLLTLVLDTVSGVRFRYTYYSGYRYTRYTYYSGYRYTRYYYTGTTYGGRIAGVVIGCLIVVGGIIAAIVAVCLLCRRRRRMRGTGGRLVTPVVFSPNTTPVTRTVVLQGNATTLGTQPPFTGYPNHPSGVTLNSEVVAPYPQGTDQKSGPMPPSYDTVVGGPTQRF